MQSTLTLDLISKLRIQQLESEEDDEVSDPGKLVI